MSKLKLNLCVAACENLGIGIKGDIPWRLKKEFAHFSRVTKLTKDSNKQNAAIMGRLTYFSIPPNKRPLVGRLNIVLSSKTDLDLPSDVVHCKTLAEAIKILETDQKYKESIENIWIVGGYSVYKEAMELENCHRIYFTEIRAKFDCDAFFPEIDKKLFQKIKIDDEDIPEEEQEENGIRYQYYIYERVPSA